MNKPPELEFVGWQQFHGLCFDLAKKISEDDTKFDTIVSISRGGHVISRILSDFLNLKIFNVSIQSYQALTQTEMKMTQKLGQYLDGQNVLLVDEVVDTGKSLQRAISYLNKLRCKSVSTCSLHIKPHAQIRPNYYAAETTSWIIYPYEVRESVDALLPIWEKFGLSKKQLLKRLVDGGMDKMMVERFL